MKKFSDIFTWIAAFFLVWWWKRNSHYDGPEPSKPVDEEYKAAQLDFDKMLEDLMSDRSTDA